MLGLCIVVVYVLAAIAAPIITQYDPTKDLFLADNLAAPLWMKNLSEKYKDAPVTISKTVDLDGWNVTEGADFSITKTTYDEEDFMLIDMPAASSSGEQDPMMEILKDIYTPEELAEMFGASAAAKTSFSMDFTFPYNYSPPNTFNFTFDYAVEGSSPEATTVARLLIISPSGKEYDIWGMDAYGDWPIS